MRLAVIFVVVFVPVVAFASSGGDTNKASLLLEAFIAAMQVYLTSKIPSIDKRLATVETELKDFIEGVVR